MLISAGAIGKIYYQRATDKKSFDKLHDIVNEFPSGTTDISHSKDTDNKDPADNKKPTPVHKRNLAPLFEMNPDCVGWVCVPDTTIDYPFMHTPKESQKYLRKNFEGTYSLSGIPFLQANCTLESDNLIIYGHNMKDGTMFSDLTGYVDEGFCEKNPIIEIETADGVKYYRVFGAAQIKSNHLWYGFTEVDSPDSFTEKLSLLDGVLLYTTDAVPEYGRQLLTLSTCYGPSQDDRLIVIAVLED